MTQTTVHTYTITKVGRRRWQSSCTCGWTSALWRTEKAADVEAFRHGESHAAG